MNLSLLIVPLASAIVGWLLNILFGRYFLYQYLPSKQGSIAEALASKMEGILPLSKIEEKIDNPQLIEKAMPMIETHIDEFLTVKLPQEIPMLAMFVGNKTTDKVKEVFIAQVRTLFPKIMGSVASDFKASVDIKATARKELEKINLPLLLKENFNQRLQMFGYVGLISGLIIGLINLLVIFLLQQQ